MTTMERPVEHGDVTTRPDRHSLVVVLVAVVALVVGALGGWMLRGSDDGTDDAIEVASGELTERQTEMLRIADEHYIAFTAGDGEKLTDLYVPQGTLVFHSDSGAPSDIDRADDGTMAAMFEGQAPPGRMEMMAPALVFGENVSQVSNRGPGYGTILHQFTTSGEVLIVNSQIVFGS